MRNEMKLKKLSPKTNHTLSLPLISFSLHLSAQNPSLNSKHCFHISALQTAHTCICLLGTGIAWKCHCAGAGPFSGLVVRGCIQLSTTSKRSCAPWVHFTPPQGLWRRAAQGGSTPPSRLPHQLQNAAFWELKPLQPCARAASSSKWWPAPTANCSLTSYCNEMDSTAAAAAAVPPQFTLEKYLWLQASRFKSTTTLSAKVRVWRSGLLCREPQFALQACNLCFSLY